MKGAPLVDVFRHEYLKNEEAPKTAMPRVDLSFAKYSRRRRLPGGGQRRAGEEIAQERRRLGLADPAVDLGA